jgi:hypothetical protein
MEADADLSRRFLEIERKIRLNKVSKNQTEKIKVQEVAQTCRERRALEKGIRAKGKSGSKSGGNSMSK